MVPAPDAVGPEDEDLHPPVDDPLWSESFYLNFSDNVGRLGGFSRIAHHPARGEIEGMLCVYLPAGGVGISYTVTELAKADRRSVCAGPLVYERVDPLKRWRIRYDGEVHVFDDSSQVPLALRPDAPVRRKERVALDLVLTGLHEPFFYPPYQKVKSPPPYVRNGSPGLRRSLVRAWRRPREIVSAVRMRTGRHYEQSILVQGTMRIGDEGFCFDGTGHRDHSWGLRDWGAPQRWRWLTGQIGDLAFNAMHLTIAGTHVINGYVWHGDRCMAVDALTLSNTFDDSGLAGRDLRLELAAGGEQLLITGEVLLNIPLPIIGDWFSTMYTFGRTRYRHGDEVGYGGAEFLERLVP